MIIEQLARRGFTMEVPEADNGRFLTATRHGDLVFTSGQLPVWGDEQVVGKVGETVTFEQAQRAAELCAFNCLRAVSTVAELESITQVVKMFGMVNVGAGFDDTSGVINGASWFLRDVLGDAGLHARSAVGMVIPAGWAVEIEMVVAVGS